MNVQIIIRKTERNRKKTKEKRRGSKQSDGTTTNNSRDTAKTHTNKATLSQGRALCTSYSTSSHVVGLHIIYIYIYPAAPSRHTCGRCLYAYTSRFIIHGPNVRCRIGYYETRHIRGCGTQRALGDSRGVGLNFEIVYQVFIIRILK